MHVPGFLVQRRSWRQVDGLWIPLRSLILRQRVSPTHASPLNTKRYLHGIGVLTVSKEEKIVVLGGNDGFNWIDDIEVYQDDIKLSEAKFSMGVLTVKKETSDSTHYHSYSFSRLLFNW